jgi:hypothetical protein
MGILRLEYRQLFLVVCIHPSSSQLVYLVSEFVILIAQCFHLSFESGILQDYIGDLPVFRYQVHLIESLPHLSILLSYHHQHLFQFTVALFIHLE